MARLINQYSIALAEAAGLDPNEVMGVTFSFKPGEREFVTFELMVNDDMIAKTKEYYLVKDGDEKPTRNEDGS